MFLPHFPFLLRFWIVQNLYVYLTESIKNVLRRISFIFLKLEWAIQLSQIIAIQTDNIMSVMLIDRAIRHKILSDINDNPELSILLAIQGCSTE